MKKVFTLFSIILMLLLSFSISAEEKPQFIFGEPLDPYSVPMLLDASTIIEFDNSNMCSDWATLSAAQQETILNNISLNDFNFSVLTTDNIVYLGKAVWCSSYDNGVYQLHSQSNVSNPGFYVVNIDGSLTKNGEIQSLSFKSIFYSSYDVGSIWFEFYDIKNSDCSVVSPPSVPPSLTLPPANIPEYTVDTDQDVFINSYGSPAIKGGRVVLHEIDYYNIYSVVQTAETDEFFDSRNDNFYIYQKTNDSYIFAVYDHSELQVFAPNMNVSNARIDLTKYLLGDFSYVYVTSNNTIIQRDVNSFILKYIDALKSRLYGYEQLPFNDSEDNKNHLEYLGVKSQSNYVNSSSSSLEVAITTEHSDYLLYFAVTDKFDDIQMGININNQTIIDNSLNHGNSLTQGSKYNLDNANNSLNSTINQFNQLDQQANQDLIDDLNAIDLNDFAINGLIQLSNSSNFVRTQFNNLTANNPIGTSVGFALVVGLSLLLLAKRL